MAYRAYILNASKEIVAALRKAEWRFTATLNAQDVLSLRTADDEAISYLEAPVSYIRLIDEADPTDIRTYLVRRPERTHQVQQVTQVEADRIWIEMSYNVFDATDGYVSIPANTLVGEILSVTPFDTGPTVNADTRLVNLKGIQSALTAIQSVADQLQVEIEIDESFAPPRIDLKRRGQDIGAHLVYGKHIKGVTRDRSPADVFTRIYPVGSGDPPANAMGPRFEVYGYAAGVITVKADKIIPSDNTFVGYKVKGITGAEAGNAFSITATVRSDSPNATTITVSGSPSFAPGDLFTLVDASGAEFRFIFDADAEATYGVREMPLTVPGVETANLLNGGAFFDDGFTGGLHTGWSKINGAEVCSEETDLEYVQHGEKSQRVQTATEGHGITRTVTLDGSEYYSAAFNLFVSAGSVLVRITGPNGEEFFNGIGTRGTDLWHKIEVQTFQIGTGSATVEIKQAGAAAADFRVDSWSFVGEMSAAPFVRYNHATELWRAGFLHLDKVKSEQVEYTVIDPVDWFAVDALRYQFQRMEEGDTLMLTDPDMDLSTSVRVLTHIKDHNYQTVGLTFATQTYQKAAFRSIDPGSADALRVEMDEKFEVLDGRIGKVERSAKSVTQQIRALAGLPSQQTAFDGEFRSLTHDSFKVEAGKLRVGQGASFAVSEQSITGLSAGTHYVYFDPNDAASGIKTDTDASIAYAENYVFLATVLASSDATERVVIYQGGTEIQGEIHTRGVEVYDDSDVKRLDLGILQDLPGYQNPSDWGQQITDGVLWQNNENADALTGGVLAGVWRMVNVVHDALVASTKTIYGDVVQVSANVGLGLVSRFALATAVAGSVGTVIVDQVKALQYGSGDTYGYYAETLETTGVGNVYGFRADTLTTVSGDVYGIYLGNLTSTSGNVWDLRANGQNYRFPSGAGSAGYVLSTSGAGVLSWIAPSAGTLTGSGTTGYIPKWTGAASLGDSLLLVDGATVRGATDGAVSLGSTIYRIGTVYLDTLGDSGQALAINALGTSFPNGGITVTGSSTITGTLGVTSYMTAWYGVFGTNSVQGALTINAPTSSDTFLYFQENGAGAFAIGHDASESEFLIYNYALGNNALVVDASSNVIVESGNLGIGASSPGNSSVTGLGFSYSPYFHVHDSGATGLTPTFSSSVGVYLRYVDTDGAANTKAADFYYANQVFAFRSLTDAGAVKTDNVLVVNASSGYVGIGTSSISSRVQITGTNTYAGAGLLLGSAGVASGYIWTTDNLYIKPNATSGSASGAIYVQDVSDNSIIALNTNGSSYFNGGIFGVGTATPDASFKLTISGNSGTVVPGIYFDDQAASPTDYTMYINGSKNFVIRDQTAGADRITVATSTGNVGVGIAPTSKLHVYGGDSSNGTIRAQAAIYPMLDFISENADSNNRNWRIAAVYSGYGRMEILHSTTSGGAPTTSLMALNGISGLVGIKRYPTTYALEVAGDGYFTDTACQVWIASSGTDSTADLYMSNDARGYYVRVDGSDNFVIRDGVAAANRLDIDTSGNGKWYQYFGVGVSPSARLHVYGSSAGTASCIRVQNSSGDQWDIGEREFNEQFAIYHVDTSSAPFRINSSDVVLITSANTFSSGSVIQIVNNTSSTASANNVFFGGYSTIDPNNTTHYYQLWASNGTARAFMTSDGGWYNNGTYGTISDERLKTEIEDAREYWYDWKLLKFRKFKMVEDVLRYGSEAPWRFGLIAQNVRNVFPSCVVKMQNGYLSYKQSILDLIQGKVIQEIGIRVESLEGRVLRLEIENADLNKKVSVLESKLAA